MIRSRDKIGVAVALLCFTAATLDVFGYGEAERKGERADCARGAESPTHWWLSHVWTAPPVRDRGSCVKPR